MKKNFKTILTLIVAIAAALSFSAFSTGNAANTDGSVTDDDGNVVGYSYDGLYWDADEYEEMISTTTSRNYRLSLSGAETLAVNHEAFLSDITDGDPFVGIELTKEDAALIDELTHPLGMAIATAMDENGNPITLLGGYTFVEEEGTSLGGLMNRLETWDINKSSLVGLFFSRDLTYKSVKVADGEQGITVDVEKQMIIFGINENIGELDQWDLLAALRTAVNSVTDKK